jgi:hypothetical protein
MNLQITSFNYLLRKYTGKLYTVEIRNWTITIITGTEQNTQ